jgi:hypothetical protein
MSDHVLDGLHARFASTNAVPPAELLGAVRAEAPGLRARSRSRTRRRPICGVAIVAGLAAVALGAGLLSQDPSRALAVDSDAGPWVEVRIQDGQAGADEMTRELQGAGINAEVQLLPAAPDFVGQWMGFLRVDRPVLPPGQDPRIPRVPCLLAVPPPLFQSHEGYIDGDLLAIRSDAELADARWVFYVGREPQGDEQPQIVSATGPIPVDPGCGSDAAR